MSAPVALSNLTVREAICDAIYRACFAIDTDDLALFESALASDAAFDLNGNVMQGIDAIRTGLFYTASKMDTTHSITNIRIDIKDGDSKASVTTSTLAQHYRPGTGMEPGATRFMTGCLYYLDCIRDETDGLWKIKHWRLKSNWTEGDVGVVTGN